MLPLYDFHLFKELTRPCASPLLYIRHSGTILYFFSSSDSIVEYYSLTAAETDKSAADAFGFDSLINSAVRMSANVGFYQTEDDKR